MSSKTDPDGYAVHYLETSQPTNSKQLYGAMLSMFPSLTLDEFADMLQRLVDRKQVDLFDQATRALSLRKFLTAWDRLLWFYGLLVFSFAAVAVAYVIPPSSPFVVARWALGLLFVLFLPGYALVEALFPSTDMDLFPRIALSVGLSLVLDMLSGLALNYTPWGIRLDPILFGLTVVTVGITLIALLRHFEMSRRGQSRVTLL